MDYGLNGYKPKRIRLNPNKKWSEVEERALVDFLMKNRDFEKPTSQLYYRRFLEKSGMQAHWKILRSKVRNMRTAYNKTKSSMIADGESTMDEARKYCLYRVFAYYDEFDVLFGNSSLLVASTTEDSSISTESFLVKVKCEPELSISHSSECMESILPESNGFCGEFDGIFENKSLESSFASNENNSDELKPLLLDNNVNNNSKELCPRTNTSIMQMQTERFQLKKHQMDQDFVLRQKELQLKEREIALKEKEIQLREKELISKEKIQILELEMKERLAMEELKCKMLS